MTMTKAESAKITDLLPEILLIKDAVLREAVTEIWFECWQESAWPDLEKVPKNTELPIKRTLVTHSRSVAQLAIKSAEVIKTFHGIDFDQDALIAASLLHDVSKMYENDPSADGKASKDSPQSRLIQHGAYGAHKAWEKHLSVEIIHNILAHTRASRTIPATWEAILVHYVDYLDSDALLFDDNHPLLLGKH